MFVLLLSLILIRCTAPTTLNQTLNTATSLITDGKYTAAEQLYQQSLQNHPDDSRPAIALAHLYLTWHYPDKGLTALRTATQRGAKETITQPLKIQLMAQKQAWEQTITEAQNWLTQSPEDANTLALLTQAQLQLGDCTAATATSERWHQATDNSNATLAWSLLNNNNAICHQRNDLCLCDDSCPVHRGYIMIRESNWPLAACLLEQAIIDETDNADAHTWLAESYARTGRQTQANDHFATATQLAPDAPLAWLLWGTQQLQWSDAESARESLLRAHSLDPENPAPCLAIAEVKAYMGLYDEVTLWIDAALERAPWDPDIWKAVARFYLNRQLTQDDYPMKAAQQAVTLTTTDDAAKAEAQLLLGWAYLQQADPTRALFELDGAIHLDPYLAHAHYLRARALQATGEHEAAQAAFIHAADLGYKE